LTRAVRLTDLDPLSLDRADVEVFPRSRLAGPQAAFYRRRIGRVPREQVEVVGSRAFRSRGEEVMVVSHLWTLDGPPVELRVQRPAGAQLLVGRFPAGFARVGDTVSLVLSAPRKSLPEDLRELRLDPGDRPVAVLDTGRRLNRSFTSARFQLTGRETEVRVPFTPQDRLRGLRLEVYRWRR
ncbi:MAG TPA: hypothetical protein VGG03_15175, partial [Thermoanaerobaculia bacterium]